MKKKLSFAVICFLCVFLCGCNIIGIGRYTSVIPHEEKNPQPAQNVVTPGKGEDLYNILWDMLIRYKDEQIISLVNIEENWQDNMTDAVEKICKSDALGAYAIDEINYELGVHNSLPAVAVEIVYTKTLANIRNIKSAADTEKAVGFIYEALNACDSSVVIHIDAFEDRDVEQIVRDYSTRFPQYVIEVPQVSVTLYPKTGSNRIMDIQFSYDTRRETLRQMQKQVGLIFSASELYVSGDSVSREKFSQLYSFLMNRYDYTLQTSITPAYSLLHHGVGDVKTFASVYAAMCRLSGLECDVINGTRNGEPWYWNVINIDGQSYHVDLLRCKEKDMFITKTSQGMKEYVWDYSSYK